MKTKYFVFICLLLIASAVNAQTVTNPNFVEFTASPDHNVNIPGVTPATPVVDHYELNISAAVTNGVLFWTEGLGKPTPDASNKIGMTVPRLLTLARGTYVASIGTVGSGITPVIALSANSLPFSATGPIAASGVPVLSRK